MILFFKKELKGEILSQNHRRSQMGGLGAQALSIEMPPMTKFDKKALFLHFQFFLASLRTTVHVFSNN